MLGTRRKLLLSISALTARLGPAPLSPASRLLHSGPVQPAEAGSLLPWRGRGARGRWEEDEVAVVGQGEVVVADRVAWDEHRQEKFIPVTRRSLVRRLGEEEALLSWEERGKLESFAATLDARFSQRFQGILEETKVYWALYTCTQLIFEGSSPSLSLPVPV